MPPFSLKLVCAIIAVILAVLILLGGDAARQMVFAAIAIIVLAVGLVVP